MDSLKGSFLVADPRLSDPNFARTVIFMVEHNAEGAFGLVLTRPTSNASLWDICQRVFDEADDFGIVLPSREVLETYDVFVGGPVQTSSVFFLHTVKELGQEEDTAESPSDNPVGAYIGNQIDDLRSILKRLDDDTNGPTLFRIFMGYSGWGPGQLEKEMESESWLTQPAKLADIFAENPEQLWGRMLSSFGGDNAILGGMPRDPGLN